MKFKGFVSEEKQQPEGLQRSNFCASARLNKGLPFGNPLFLRQRRSSENTHEDGGVSVFFACKN